MPRRDTFKVIAEKYESLYTEVREVRQVPFSQEELTVLTRLYDFEKKSENEVKRIVAAGEVETVIKYSDNSFVRMKDDSRGITKYEYRSFYQLIQGLEDIYKPDTKLNKLQTPEGPDSPTGVQKGATNLV